MLRLAALLLSPAALVACAVLPPAPGEVERDSPSLEAIAAAVSGDFVSIRRADDSGTPVYLQLEAEALGDGLALVLTQRQADSERVFDIALRPSSSSDRFNARFVPRSAAQGAAAPACDMNFRLTNNALIGVTDPATCRFQADGRSIGLLKELSFEGDRILMADQLVLEDGSLWGRLDQLSLARVLHFRGMLAQREGSSWRLARHLQLSTSGHLIEPLDAAGMSLGVLLNLEWVESMREQRPALRLQLLEEASGQVLGEVWSNPGALMIGLGLDGQRLELEREP